MSTDINLQGLTLEDGRATAASYESLPTELLLMIIVQLPDLVSLDSLLRASPVTHRIFDDYAYEITEAILNSGFTCGHVRVLINIVAAIRSSTLPIDNLRSFTYRVTDDAMHYASRVRESDYAFAPRHLAKNTRPVVIRSILATARRLTWLALDCLKFYLARFRPLRPLHPVLDEKFKIFRTPKAPRSKDYVPAWECRPEGREFDVRDVGPPSWTEEQRAVRAFWRLQLIVDLKKAAASSMLKWSQSDIDTLNEYSPLEDFYGPMSYQRHNWEEYKDNPEAEELESIIEYSREIHGRDPTTDLSDSQLWLPQTSTACEVRRDWPIPSPEGKDWRKLVFQSPGCQFYWWESKHNGSFSPEYSPFAILDASLRAQLPSFHYIRRFSRTRNPFRRFGVAFWSSERMCASGLMHPFPRGSHAIARRHRYWYAWQSILSPDEITEIEEKSRAIWG